MKSYTGYENSKTNTTIMAGKGGPGRDQYALGENESQERIMEGVRYEGKDGVFVTQTVNVQ